MPHYTCHDFPLCYKCYPINQHHQRFLDAFILKLKKEVIAELEREKTNKLWYERQLEREVEKQEQEALVELRKRKIKYESKEVIKRIKQCVYREKNRKKTKHEDRIQAYRAKRLQEVLTEWGLPLPPIDLNLYQLPPIHELFR